MRASALILVCALVIIIRTSYDPDSGVRDGVAEVAVTLDAEDISDLVLRTVPER